MFVLYNVLKIDLQRNFMQLQYFTIFFKWKKNYSADDNYEGTRVSIPFSKNKIKLVLEGWINQF